MPWYKIPATWKESSDFYTEAESLEEAIANICHSVEIGETEVPDPDSYVDGTFVVDHNACCECEAPD